MLKETLKVFYVAELSPSMKESAFQKNFTFSVGFGWGFQFCIRTRQSLVALWPCVVRVVWSTTALCQVFPGRRFISHKCLNILNNAYIRGHCDIFTGFPLHCAALVNTHRLYSMILYLQCGFNALSYRFIVDCRLLRRCSQNISKHTTCI